MKNTQQPDITKMTDIELAKIYGQQYQLLIQVQGNLVAINDEIEKRSNVKKQKE